MMKKNLIIILAIALFLLVVLLGIFAEYDVTNIYIEGWSDFKKNITSKYTYVNDIRAYSVIPPCLKIDVYLDKEIDMKNIELIFEDVKKCILTEKIFQGLQKLHKKTNYDTFVQIKITFIYVESNIKYEFFASQQYDREPTHNDFDKWYIKYDREPAKEYYPGHKE